MADIVIRGVSKSFDRGRATAVRDVDLHVAEGEFFVLLGPSGCGKTTLLRMIAGLDFADSGTVAIGQRDVTTLPPRQRDLAMVFQNYAVFPHLTVFQNIAFGLRMKHTDARVTDERVRWAADIVELSGLLQRRPGQLSGGQRQRVALARAIAAGPSVLLMDEPLSNLDALLRLKFRSDLKRIVHELKTTTIYVTHDQVEALSLGDRLAVMRDGEIIQCDTPLRVYSRPANTFVGGFIGNPPMNFLPVTAEEVDGQLAARVGGHGFPMPAELRPFMGRSLLAGIRAENVLASAVEVAGSVLGKVLVTESLGSHVLVTLTIDGTEFKVVAPTDFIAVEDADLWLRPVPETVRWYDPETRHEVQPEHAQAGSLP
jgi:multiple sugar transport system ATP-binding protein